MSTSAALRGSSETVRILLVDDDEDDYQLTRGIVRGIRSFDSNLHWEKTYDSGLSALRERQTDVCLLDYRLGAKSGLELLATARDGGCTIPIIFLTGKAERDTDAVAMKSGADDYLGKSELTSTILERSIRYALERAHHVEELRQSERRCRHIVETTNQGVCIFDIRGRMSFVNGRIASMLGFDRSEMIGRSFFDLVDEDCRKAAVRDAARSHEGAVQVESKLRRKDGEALWVLLEISPTFAESGTYEGSFAMIMNVTERKIAEEALRVSEARLRRLWDSGLVLITVSDTKGNIVDINETGARLLGYSRDELLSGTVKWNDITPPEYRALDEAAQAQLAANGVSSPWEKELIRKDGGRVTILTGAALLDGSEGIAVAIDVTEKKRDQTDLLERVRIAALTAEVGMALTRDQSVTDTLRQCTEAMVTHLDAAFARIWTLNSAENVLELQASAGQYTHLDGPHARVPVGKFKIGLIAEERLPHCTNDVLHDSRIGDREWARREGMVAFAGHPLLVAGHMVGVVALFARHPLSDAVCTGLGSLADAIAVGVQRRVAEETGQSLEAQLRQAQKMEAVGRLAGGIAHDFNNVLSVVLSYSELILADLKYGDPLREDIEEIRTAGRRAADLTRQLLMFSRQQVMEPKVLDLNGVLTSMDKMLRRILGEDVELVSLPAAALGRLRADPSSIEQVIMNLVVNARDAMPKGGKLTMETANVVLDKAYAQNHFGAKPGAYVMLTVTDSGTGMDKATLARIFEPFFTTKEQGKGTGLGLSTVFGIVQQSGGSVWVNSEPGAGTRFEVYLPTVDADIESARPQQGPTTLRGSETILLVEDEEQVRDVARGILRRHGYTVLDARNGGEAFMICERHQGVIDLLVSDVVMPQMSGPELAKRLALLRPEMKLLCMSGYTDDAAVRHGVVDAEFAFLQKPLTVESLTRKVRDVLDSKRKSI